ncbi:helix-turn-helix domain-containing protein [Peribacillus asahii]|uniref:helix-turn-helix domain-containing protein n=1 Tax=Peribacillus asahii TaxID=228899 RepID=UPI00207A40AE|nr:helix-turn-helix domain-containing protein [Peribacillus asahii]USK60405.1 helix-turn-helix domain-containing protein [Peribacillus asahii]
MLTTKEISQILNVSEETVRRWIRNKDLKASQEGKSYLVDKDDLIEFVKEKAKEGTNTSIGKMASLLPIAGAIFAGPAGLVAGGATASLSKIIKMINSKTESSKTDKSVIDLEEKSIAEIEDYINALKRQKKKLDLEYQMNILQIEEEILKYQKLKQELEME